MKNVAVILGWHAEPLVSGIFDYAEYAGWSVDIHFQRIRRIPSFLRFDGVVCSCAEMEEVASAIGSLDCPVVSLTDSRFRGALLPYVTPDEEHVGRDAADYFLGKGFYHFASYAQFMGEGASMRLEAYVERLKEYLYEVHAIEWPYVLGNGSDVELHEWLLPQLKALPKPCAVFASTDDHARVLLEVCMANGILVPEELAILGANNEARLCECSHMPLSSVDVNLRRNGYLAAEHLDLLMAGADCPRATLVPSGGVIERSSTDSHPIEDSVTRETLHYLRTHFHEPIDVNDLAGRTGQSLSSLKSRFAEYVGVSAKSELNRLRLQKAKRLLERTDLKASVVAGECGYQSLESFSRFFKKQAGVSIREFRSG